MAELSIKVNIANRTYPLAVQPEEEEEVRKAAAYINEQIKQMESNYAVKDKQDLLAMLTLQITLEKGHGKEELINDTLAEKMENLASKIEQALHQ